MNIKILESHHFNSQTNELLQQYLIEHHLPKIGFYHVVAIKDHTIIALGMLYTNNTHPHRDYILFHDVQDYLEPSIFSKLINFLEKNSKIKRLQLLLNSRDTHLHKLLELHGFYIARTSYLIELTRLNEIITDTRTIRTKSLNHMSLDEWIEFKKLFHFNYSRYHESVNRLAQEIPPNQLFENLENINLAQSRILLNSHDDPCAYVLIGNSDDNLIEIAYIGGMYEDRMNYYLTFFQDELKTLLKKYKTIYFEADDSDYYISALIQIFNFDLSNSFYTLIKDVN
ncbi:hypothetical protein [Acinetobacter sp.]|uniref:hypothetical protein n=1 Tax=Acinetobacter sp. TaxID=472 RepID=UPI003BAF16B5